MKKISLILCSLYLLSFVAVAQVPQTFNYQAIARDQNGNLMGNESLTVRIGILKEETLIWQEEHSVTTSSIGLFTLNIGDLQASNTGGTVAAFADVPWDEGDFQLQVSIDAGDGFLDLGTSEFQSVPYALYAASGAGGGNSQWVSDQDTISTLNYVGIGTTNPNQSTLAVQGINVQSESPLFEVRREDGFPVFAVYNDGVMVFVDDDGKGVKGGFAVGGYNRTSKGVTQEYLRVTPDSVRVYVPEAIETKGVKGGFAVGGYNRTSRSRGRDFLYVTPDSTRVYVPNKVNDPGVTGLQGGFAVSGFDRGTKAGETTDYLMGTNRGITRFNTTDPDRGFAIGSLEDGWGSNYLELTPTNSFMGTDAGLNNIHVDPEDQWGLGTMNIFLGYQTGMENLTGHHNTFMGFCAGTNTLGGDSEFPELGSENIFIGSQAGFMNTHGHNNVYIGFNAGFHNTDGRRNIFLGHQAGLNETGSDRLYIGNSDTEYPLIYGQFETQYLELNAHVTVAGTLTELSDLNMKTNIAQVTNSINKIKQIKGVSFQWKEQAIRKGSESESSIGFIAQEIETVFPALVREDRMGRKSVNYSGMIPVLLEAIKEQQSQIEALEKRIAELE